MEEDKDVLEAADILFGMQGRVLNYETANELRGKLIEYHNNELRQEFDFPLPKLLKGIIGVHGSCHEKQLTNSDIQDGQGRRLIPIGYVKSEILPLLMEKEDPIKGIDVTIYDQKAEQYEMVFKRWCSKSFVLIKDWKRFICKNDLKVHDYITIRVFRHAKTMKLCFIITWNKMPRSENNEDEDEDRNATRPRM